MLLHMFLCVYEWWNYAGLPLYTFSGVNIVSISNQFFPIPNTIIHTYIMSRSLPLINKSKKNSFSQNNNNRLWLEIQTTQKKYICTLLIMFLVQFGNKHRNKSIGFQTLYSKRNLIASIRRRNFYIIFNTCIPHFTLIIIIFLAKYDSQNLMTKSILLPIRSTRRYN